MRRKLKSKKDTEFETLKDQWYKKLEDSGFDDIEQDEFKLKAWSSQLFIHSTQTSWEAKAIYYQMATNFLEEYKFSSKLDQIIWEYHANGLGVREIAKIVSRLKVKKKEKDTIARIIAGLKIKMFTMYLQPMKEYHE